MKTWAIAALALSCVACGGSETPVFRVGAQNWNDVSLSVEARQSPMDAQMYEFLVYATDTAKRKPAHDFNMALRVNADTPWKQAIQDGWSGVYRRAYKVADPNGDVLQIQLRRGEDQTELQFPLANWTPLTP